MQTLTEQRKSARTELAWPVSIWLPAANRFFNGQSCNISQGGALLQLPITTPIRTGNVVEINFPRTTALAREKGSFARIKSGEVVRVNRKDMLKNGCIGVGLKFS